jgi:hypothetical protein
MRWGPRSRRKRPRRRSSPRRPSCGAQEGARCPTDTLPPDRN